MADAAAVAPTVRTTCAACGFVAVDGPSATCAECGWIADRLQLAQPDLTLGANHGTSLREAQAAALRRRPLEAPETGDRVRDPRWRPLEPGESPPPSEGHCASATCLLAEGDDAAGPEPEPYWLSSPRAPLATPVIRAARPDEAAALSAIARASKAHWGYEERWLDEWRDDLSLAAERIAANPVFVLESAGERLGFCALAPRGAEWQLEHLWLLPSAIGHGHGRRLFDFAADYAAARGAAALRIDADPYAEPFYLHVGAVRVGEVRADLDDVPRFRPQMRFELASRGATR